MAQNSARSFWQLFINLLTMTVGCFLVVYALEVFLIPNRIIDGGIVGISILSARVFGQGMTYPLAFVLSLPFMVLAKIYIGRSLLLKMFFALAIFGFFGWYIESSNLSIFTHYVGDRVEIVVIGGMILGIGAGTILRAGGCLDGTEILAILINKKFGFTVGSVILFFNAIIFACAGLIFNDWQSALQSMVTFLVASRIMDMTIRGMEDSKCLQILSTKPQQIADSLMHELGLGLTIIHAKGGFSREKRDILFLIAERLQIQPIREIVEEKDPNAHIVVTNINDLFSASSAAITERKHSYRKKYPTRAREGS